MSRAIGSRLPVPLRERLRGDDLATRVGIAVLILTTDEAGWPHPAMVSYGELVAMDSRRVRLAVRRTSGTAENLRRRGRMTFCFIEPGMAYYVKATVGHPEEPVQGFPDLVRFEATVEKVLADEARADSEPGVAVADGVRFSSGRTAAAVTRDWRRVVESLREGA
jgi:hypothetical protein